MQVWTKELEEEFKRDPEYANQFKKDINRIDTVKPVMTEEVIEDGEG
jgi:hypothetical protein